MREAEARAVLTSFCGRPQLAGDAGFASMLAVLDHHPRWGRGLPGHARISGLRAFVRRDALVLQAQVDQRSRWLAVSWLKGAERRHVPDAAARARSTLTAAMRESVKYQLMAWRRQQQAVVCAGCRTTTAAMHVDHRDPPFVTIKDEFLAAHADEAPATFVGGGRSGRCRLPAGPFCAAWQQWHRRRATFQYLCRTCNLRKGKRAEVLPQLPKPLSARALARNAAARAAAGRAAAERAATATAATVAAVAATTTTATAATAATVAAATTTTTAATVAAVAATTATATAATAATVAAVAATTTTAAPQLPPLGRRRRSAMVMAAAVIHGTVDRLTNAGGCCGCGGDPIASAGPTAAVVVVSGAAGVAAAATCAATDVELDDF